jgi:hypothetical protein
MFIEVHIIQCISSGEFLTHRLNYTSNVAMAGLFTNRQSAVDTGFDDLDNDFRIFSVYIKENQLPAYCCAGGFSPPQ